MKKIDELIEQIDLRKIFQEGLYFLTFLIFLSILCAINYYFTGQIAPSNETRNLWFWSGLVMILFTNYFVEPYYTAPTNVFANSFALVLMMISIPQSEFGSSYWWWTGTIFFTTLLLSSFFSKIIYDKNNSDEFTRNKISNGIKEIVVLIGRGKVLFSFILFYFLFINFSDNTFSNGYTLTLFVFWAIVVLLSPEDTKKFIERNFFKGDETVKNKSLGKIFAVQSDGMFLVRLFDNKTTTKFSTVIFQNQISRDDDNLFSIGFIFDVYFLDDEKWAKVVFIKKMSRDENDAIDRKDYKKDFVYKTEHEYISKEVANFVGVVVEGSEIGRIKFEYSEKSENLEEGDLLELHTRDKKIFYQVTNGDTHKEKLESWNESGFIIGQALQLGEWHTDLSFEKFGWVPPINTPLFKASTEKEESEIGEIIYPEYKLGIIPKTNLPSIINFEHAISHHMALLGVTGSGKSYLARKIIDQIKTDTKVICVDFNKEFITELTPTPPNVINAEKAKEIAQKIDWINNELEKFGNQQDKTGIVTKQEEIKETLRIEIAAFLDSATENINVFELPDVSNTTGVLDYTKYFFKVLFEVAKERQIANTPVKLCVVLEEAHTIIPEWNFSGSSDKTSQGLVNSIGQIALQGRKYGIGFLIIAQRTANVSKTVLTQCNTVVCFQAFDETSFNFLGNYVGRDIAQALPNLKQYHAVVAGKAIKSNTPMIIDFTVKNHEN